MIQPVQGAITTWFDKWVNYRIVGHPTRIYQGKKQWQHQAWDIVTQKPAPIYAPADCTVIQKIDGKPESYVQGYGNELYVRFDDGAVMRTAHMSINIPVSEGQRVPKGALLGYTGKTGFRIPEWVIHTHLEILINGIRVDPEKYNPPQPAPPPINPPNDDDMPRREALHKKFTLCSVKDFPNSGTTNIFVVTFNDRSKGYWEVRTEDIEETVNLFHGEIDTTQKYSGLGSRKQDWGGMWSVNQAGKNWPEILKF